MKAKKILAAVLAGTMVMASASVAFAATTVSNSAFWDAWTPAYEIVDGDTLNLDFYFTQGAEAVYASLNAVFTNTAIDGTIDPSAAGNYDGYTEYAALRSDNWGWGEYYDNGGVTYTGTDYLFNEDITDYTSVITGAHYAISISRSGSSVQYDYVITEADGTVLNCGYAIDLSGADLSSGLYVFFTGDAGTSFTDEAPSSAAAETTAAATTSTTTGTGDAAPIAAVAIALIGCGAIVIASRKKNA